MAIKLRLTKADKTTPWGFRLTGGANFEVPLTTIKVNENSIAQKCGLEIGDIIIKINDDDITSLTHAQAHDRIIQAGETLLFTIVRGQISEALQTLVQEEESNHEVYNILEGTVPIDYPERTLEDLVKDTEKEHDLNLTDEEIHCIIGPGIVTTKGNVPSEPSKITNQTKWGNGMNGITRKEVEVFQSEVIKEINNNMKELIEPERRWSTFLQRPLNPVPEFKAKFEVQKSTYKVKIRTKKDLEAEREAKKLEMEASLLQQANSGDLLIEDIQEVAEELSLDEGKELEDSDVTFSDSENITEDTITFSKSGTEPTISFTESLTSLEDKLEKVKEELQFYHIDMVPESLQKTLTKIAAQLEKIVRVVKPAAKGKTMKGPEVSENDVSDEQLSDDESINLDSRISSPTPSTPTYQGTEPTLTFNSDSIMSDLPSASTPEGSEKSLTFSDDAVDFAECDRTDLDVTEMHEFQEDVPAGLMKEKDANEGKTSKKEKIEHWNQIWPWTRVTQPIYRESNCCMVLSKMTETNKINFLKYQPPPKNLDHLKNSEVYKMVHNVNADESKGIFTRPEKVLAEQDYHASQQEPKQPTQMER